MNKIMIVEDDRSHLKMLGTSLKEWGYSVICAKNGKEALNKLETLESKPALVLTDMRMPQMNGLELMKEINKITPEISVIIMTAYSAVDDAVDAMRNGAYDYLAKPLDLAKLKQILQNFFIPQKGDNPESSGTFKLGNASAIREVEEIIKASAPTEAVILITGESGTGKEVVARLIHSQSKRADGPFVGVNCGALSANLMESELFGHEKGAFTGAEKMKTGLFAEAENGTLFLDEIGELPLSMQVKLLRVLQEREFMRVGSQKTSLVNCRIIAASNRHLQEEVRQGRFREDLFYRLNVVNIELPALSERKEDIPGLAKLFAEKFAQKYEKIFKGFTGKTMDYLLNYPWPGNIRELENVIERAIILMLGEYLEPRLLPDIILKNSDGVSSAIKDNQPLKKQLSLSENQNEEITGTQPIKMTLEEAEKKHIAEALRECKNNKSLAAKMLGISRKTLYSKIAEYNFNK